MVNMATLLCCLLSSIAVGIHCKLVWPDGTYGLPMPRTECPESSTYTFRTGSRIQETESGSISSSPCHLHDCPMNSRSVKSLFCMKLTQSEPNGGEPDVKVAKWSAGQYCIYKKNDCPTGFRYGSLRWDDASSVLLPRGDQASFGVLPDGVYNKDTIIHFCCRNDGSHSDILELPTEKPFYLLKWGRNCQKVRNTNVSEEWVTFKTERTINMDSKSGLHPEVSVTSMKGSHLKLFYCYYEYHPVSDKARGIVILLIVVAAVLGGGILLFLVLFCTSRLFQVYKERSNTNLQRDSISIDATAPIRPNDQHKPSTSLLTPVSVDLLPPSYEEATRLRSSGD